MKQTDLVFLARLRLIVGYLGESSQFGWWRSSFLSPSSKTFLSPVFGKTMFLAQYHGVKEAAMKTHDNYIGVGRGVFHLFRLPESIERRLHGLLCDSKIINQLPRDIVCVKDALRTLKLFGNKSADFTVGPVLIGNLSDIKKMESWQLTARYYWHSFDKNNRVYPFFLENDDS